MFGPFFATAALSPGRQRSFRQLVIFHLLSLVGAGWWMSAAGPKAEEIFGSLLLVVGIVEGALLIGWRLTQLPKSQALEFLLVSDLHPWRVFLAEAAVGLTRLAFITLSGLPILGVLVLCGALEWLDVAVMLAMPFTWGAVTGLGLAEWAYEPRRLRVWAERLVLLMITIYLGVGVLAGERLVDWIKSLPPTLGQIVLISFEGFHRYNPFGIVRFWFTEDLPAVWIPTVTIELVALALVALMAARCAMRLLGHFHERHYLPAADVSRDHRNPVTEQPLSWWAVKRVSEYSGRVNLWLAGGFSLLYAAYLLAGPAWPASLGRAVFVIFDQAGGVPALTAALVVLAAVPAAFQYGLWDAHAQDRCRRMELLLLTPLSSLDYWQASCAAAWRRGRGYFGVAVMLWIVAAFTQPQGIWQALAGLAAGVVLWSLYFALGFRAFTRGGGANRLGLILTVGLPMLAFLAGKQGWVFVAGLLPPGGVYQATSLSPVAAWPVGLLVAGIGAIFISRSALTHCESALRAWYDRHHGQLVAE